MALGFAQETNLGFLLAYLSCVLACPAMSPAPCLFMKMCFVVNELPVQPCLWKTKSSHQIPFLLVFKLDTLKENNLKNVEELNKSKELLTVENQKMETFKKEM